MSKLYHQPSTTGEPVPRERLPFRLIRVVEPNIGHSITEVWLLPDDAFAQALADCGWAEAPPQPQAGPGERVRWTGDAWSVEPVPVLQISEPEPQPAPTATISSMGGLPAGATLTIGGVSLLALGNGTLVPIGGGTL